VSTIFHNIDHFFKNKFKKKFIYATSSILLLSFLFLMDIYILPGSTKTDVVYSFRKITQQTGNSWNRSKRTVGYKYTTENEHQFSTSRRGLLKSPKITMEISPITKTVKSVQLNGKPIKLTSGVNGANMVLLISCNLIILISISYITLVKNLSENSRLNLIYLNLFVFSVWIYMLVLY